MKQSVDLHEYRGRPWRVHERLVHLLVHRPHAREDLHKNNNHPWLVITICILTCADNVMDDVTAIEKQNLPRLDLDPTFNFSGHMITVFVSCITCSSQEIKWRIEINKYFEFSKSLKRKIRDFFWGVRKVKQLEWQSGEHWAGGRERQLAFIDSGELRHPSSSSRAGHQRSQVSPSVTLALSANQNAASICDVLGCIPSSQNSNFKTWRLPDERNVLLLPRCHLLPALWIK